jgi:nucleoside-diphosphate-sugar epimerase
MHVEDVAAAFVALLDSAVEGPVNIASGQPVTLREVVLTAADHLGARELVQFGEIPAPANDPALLVGDRRRLMDELNWTPKLKLGSGIINTIDWWRRHIKEETNA